MVTAGNRALARHWPTFAALRTDIAERRVVIGIDRDYARRWTIGGRGAPFIARLASRLVLVLIVLATVGIGIAAWRQSWLLIVLLFITAMLCWRLMLDLAVSAARRTLATDEALFREWFAARRISLFLPDRDEYVWNDDEAG